MGMLEEMLAMGKKKGGKMLPAEKEAKMSVLKEISDLASGAMADDVKGLKKVTVAAPDQAGLEEGLEKAQEMVGSEDESSEDEEEACGKCGKGPCECETPAEDGMGKLSPEEMAIFKKLQEKMKA